MKLAPSRGFRSIIALIVVAAIPAAAYAGPDLSGTWNGTITGAINGTATLTVVDTGDTGTFSGGFNTDTAGNVTFQGTFVQVGRRVQGTVSFSGGGSINFAGRSNRLAENLRWHFLMPGGAGRVDVELTQVP